MLTYILNDELARAAKQGNFKVIDAFTNDHGLTLIVQNVVTEKCLRLHFRNPRVSDMKVDLIGLTMLGIAINRFVSMFRTKYFSAIYAVFTDDKKQKIVIRGDQV